MRTLLTGAKGQLARCLRDRLPEDWELIATDSKTLDITDRDAVGPIRERVLSLVTDALAVGVDPQRSTIFAHSAVPAQNQLMLPFLSLVTESELHRNPTVKSELEATDGRAMSGLLLTYPVHQATDILFCQANLVPVGKDQLPHLEQARLIAQRFDKRYGRAVKDHPVFRRPEALLSQAPMLLGLDGEKMSKSRHNTIELRMSADETAKALKKAKTDSERVITYDPANRPEVSNLLMLASLCGAGAPEEIAERIGDAEIAVTNKTPLTRAVIDACPNLKAIAVLATGYNIVDTVYAREKNIPVMNVPVYGTDNVAQYAIALLLEACSQVGHHDRSVHAGEWTRSIDFCYWQKPLIEVSGKTAGTIGFGRIGFHIEGDLRRLVELA